jgi:hypothetical protein
MSAPVPWLGIICLLVAALRPNSLLRIVIDGDESVYFATAQDSLLCQRIAEEPVLSKIFTNGRNYE